MLHTSFHTHRRLLGWSYDSGNYDAAMRVALDTVGYDALRKEQAEKREKGEFMGIGVSSFVEVGGRPTFHTFDIAGIKMFDSRGDSRSSHWQGYLPHGNQEPGSGTGGQRLFYAQIGLRS